MRQLIQRHGSFDQLPAHTGDIDDGGVGRCCAVVIDNNGRRIGEYLARLTQVVAKDRRADGICSITQGKGGGNLLVVGASDGKGKRL